jgi:hypothetical protein
MQPKTNKQVNKAPQGNKKKSPVKRVQPKPNRMPPVFYTIADPFNAPTAHFPDPDVTPSGLLTSRFHIRSSFPALGGTGTVHSFAITLNPHPFQPYNVWLENTVGSGSLTDLNLPGTAFASAFTGTTLPNYGSFGLNTFQVRCVGIGCRVTYEGTELNRSGRIFGGLLNAVGQATTTVTTGTFLSQINVLVPPAGANNVTTTLTTIRDSMNECASMRITDNVHEFIWKPSCIPTYQKSDNSTGATPVRTTTAGNTTSVTPSVWESPPGGNGIQASQNSLCIVIEGDTTPSASLLSNVYDLDLIYHWEVVPDDITAVAYSVSPSVAHSLEMDQVFNSLAKVPLGRCYPAVNEGFRTV